MNKNKILEENERLYGKEIKEKYDENIVNASYMKVKGMSDVQLEKARQISEEINLTLEEAMIEGNPESVLAQKACELHKEWLCIFWPDDFYSKEAHKQLVEGYLFDDRFIAYYDQIAKGCTKFLNDAIKVYCR